MIKTLEDHESSDWEHQMLAEMGKPPSSEEYATLAKCRNLSRQGLEDLDRAMRMNELSRLRLLQENPQPYPVPDVRIKGLQPMQEEEVMTECPANNPGIMDHLISRATKIHIGVTTDGPRQVRIDGDRILTFKYPVPRGYGLRGTLIGVYEGKIEMEWILEDLVSLACHNCPESKINCTAHRGNNAET